MSILKKFLPGIILIQVVTAILVLAIVKTPESSWAFYGLLALIASFVTVFWLASIADHLRKDAIAQIRGKQTQERERLLASAEREKRRAFEQAHKRIVKESNRAYAKANFKVGAVVVGAVGVGVGLLTLQFITIGVTTLLTASGALTGYAVRAYQDALASKGSADRESIAQQRPTALIEGKTSEPPTTSSSLDKHTED